jgi:hypothetical protein
VLPYVLSYILIPAEVATMEALASVATIVQLIEFTAKILKATSNLCRDVQDTPTELGDLIKHLNRIDRLLELVRLIEASSKTQFSPTGLSSLRPLLLSVEATISKLQKRYGKYKKKLGMCRRLKLAVLESSAIEKYSNRIQAFETELLLQLFCRLVAFIKFARNIDNFDI